MGNVKGTNRVTPQQAALIIKMVRDLAGDAATVKLDSLHEFGVDAGIVTIRIYTEDTQDDTTVLSETE